MARRPKSTGIDIETLRHEEAKRKNIPTAELEALVEEDEKAPEQKVVRPPREVAPQVRERNPDLDPQLVWRGKEAQDAEGLTVPTVPVYIQEKIHPQAIIADLKRRSDRARKERAEQERDFVPDLFADFNGLEDKEAEVEFYEHDRNWTNRMILGDSLLVMTSLAEKEALKAQVQCIYFDPPYGINFRSNWQVSTNQKTGDQDNQQNLSREPEMVKAFRDTWRDGIHTYLAYLRDRLVVCRDLLSDTGSIFVQIGEENVHLVRLVMDEVFGRQNAIVTFLVKKKGSQKSGLVDPVNDYILWYGKSSRGGGSVKYRPLYAKRDIDEETLQEFSRVEFSDGSEKSLAVLEREIGASGFYRAHPKRLFSDFPGARLFRPWPITNGGSRANQNDPIKFQGKYIEPPSGRCWSHTSRSDDNTVPGMYRLALAGRLVSSRNSLDFKRYLDDFPFKTISNWWDNLGGASSPIYVVQTNEAIVKRCILMTTDPGDLVLDPTCGSGTTAYVAEHWGRRWITIDTSRVALALARQRLMAGRFPSYLLQDSEEGARKEAELTGKPPREGPFRRSVRQGFVYRRAPWITSGAIANNAEIDVIWDRWQETLGPLLDQINASLGEVWEEWQVPREPSDEWPDQVKALHGKWWEARRKRQEEIDASIARNAEVEYLYDRPYENKSKVRVTGPFTVESLSPHRVLTPDDDDDEMLAVVEEEAAERGRSLPPRTRSLRREDAAPGEDDFVRVVLDNLRQAGVQNTKKGERLVFTELKPWPGGRFIHTEGRYEEAGREKRVAVFIGPEYGTVSKGMVRQAAREALDSAFHTLVVCGFAFEPQVNEESLARFPNLTVLKARMNADLHMADALRSGSGAANLFVVFGEPDVAVRRTDDDRVQVEILGVDIFDPTTGEVRSSSLDDIACWFIDTDYDSESFFVRHAYFLGGNDPYKKLKTTLKAEIDEDSWATLYSPTSRPFDPPSTGKIAVKVINHYGDEVLKVYEVG